MVQRLATARDDDSHWLLAAALTAEAAVLLRDARAATVLRHRLAPHAGAIVVAGRLGACRGSLRYHLGVLALTAGDHAEAIMHLEKAEEQHARPGFAAHLPRTVVALTRARRGARLAEWSAAGPWSLIRTGGYWALHGPSGTSALPDVKGMRYLARVLAAPHVEFGALDLFRMDAAGPGTTATAPGAGLTVDAGGADPILDATAKRAYRERLRALADELSAAQRLHDDERAADLHDEQTALEAVLSVGVGLSGRDRHLPSEAERARSSVTKALRAAIDRIRAVDSDLGAHLDASLRTGKRCCYAPDGPPLADSPG
jgi:non-specific serine/threonine protein kinase